MIYKDLRDFMKSCDKCILPLITRRSSVQIRLPQPEKHPVSSEIGCFFILFWPAEKRAFSFWCTFSAQHRKNTEFGARCYAFFLLNMTSARHSAACALFSSMMWLYKFSVVFTLACPSCFETVTTSVPLAIRTEATVCRNA